jgi:predicted DsbA family dithiol-disulfide isomerase
VPQSLQITEYTDPGCPFAFSAEPHKLRLRWLYGDQISFNVRMVGLSKTREENAAKGLTPEMLVKGQEGLAAKFGMPIDTTVREAVPATMPACRAVVAVRTHVDEPTAELLLRELRVMAMSNTGLLDDPDAIAAAAEPAGIARTDLDAWVASDETEEALRADMLAARTPTPAALALKGKLARWENGWRYTCPSYEIHGERQLSVPGMQSSLSYEVAVANLTPDIERREAPENVEELLAWAPYRLATQEVAEVMGTSREEAAEMLVAAGAPRWDVGTDAYWTSQ